ncbi:MAG TPA: hypothetical protein RMF84_16150 [Polyangiaceae bacterium LLY-WYZ-14_1]|jgi:hypothetical protein|nr:hypothetical protein [Polyangiaceae bacterium LLY-WYZ-14_1]
MLETVSDTSKTWVRRENRRKKAGQDNKKKRAREGTPKFPIHPEQADSSTKKDTADAPN